MTDAFLSKEEVLRLTGYKYPAYQAKFLTEIGIRFTRNRFGEVIVPRSAIDGSDKNADDEPPFELHYVP